MYNGGAGCLPHPEAKLKTRFLEVHKKVLSKRFNYLQAIRKKWYISLVRVWTQIFRTSYFSDNYFIPLFNYYFNYLIKTQISTKIPGAHLVSTPQRVQVYESMKP